MELISRNEDNDQYFGGFQRVRQRSDFYKAKHSLDKVETKAPEILKYTYIILQGKYMVCYLISKSMHKLII